MKLTCPRHSCQNQTSFAKDGFYFRKSDSKTIQRYRCTLCGKKTSTAQLSSCYGQNKRTINPMIESLLCAKVSQRRMAKILNVDKKTIHRKLIFLGKKAALFNQKFRETFIKNKIQNIQFDDLITKEKTKLKPVSITGIVDVNSRKILALESAQIPSFGHLAKVSRKKYGYRKSHHEKALTRAFEKIKDIVDQKALIRSDEHKRYPKMVKKYFPRSNYQSYPSVKGCVAGQGELKKVHRDPLFAINHSFAMLRDNISRLVRRSWCVTQDLKMLQYHLEIYIKYHNTKLV